MKEGPLSSSLWSLSDKSSSPPLSLTGEAAGPVQDPCGPLPPPGGLKITRRVGLSGLLLAWTAPEDPRVTGYAV